MKDVRPILLLLLYTAYSSQFTVPLEELHIEDAEYWNTVGAEELKSTLARKFYNGKAKNVIVFVGDGMGPTTVTAARIYQGQTSNTLGETNILSFEKFSAVGLSKTYNVNRQVSDSASTATAMFCGVKTNQNVVGFDMHAVYNVCNSENDNRARVSSIMEWGQQAGKTTGIVTTTRVTHATPAATYAHSNNRDWECNSEIPAVFRTCAKDIARQLVEDTPGKNFKVILGGGTKQFGASQLPQESEDDSCRRTDGMNLVENWKSNKTNSRYVTTAEQLQNVNSKDTDYLFGLFAEGHLSYVGEGVPTRPSLALMTTKAIEILHKNSKGYVLMVEGGRIDQAHHSNYAKLALMEAVEFDEAVTAAVKMTNPEETLILVTADHSHAFSMNGYPKRGNDILGLAKETDKVWYETLTYTNGPGYKYHHNNLKQNVTSCKGICSEVEQQSSEGARDLRNDTDRLNDIHYQNYAAFYLKDDTHGGEDVAIYAQGPMSHLFVGVHEQNYIAHVISYAACIGPHASKCISADHIRSSSSAPPTVNLTFSLFLATLLSLALFPTTYSYVPTF